MKAGTAQRDITPPVGMPIDAPRRESVGVHDRLFVRALVLDDETGESVAIVCFDLIGCGFEAAGAIRQAIRERTGIEHALLNFAHPHSSRGLGCPGEHGDMSADEIAWHDATHRAILDVVAEARAGAAPATLRAGRAAAQVGYNRRITYPDGSVGMGDNKGGAVVPWVNVLVAERKDGRDLISVLFEHAAHPVIVPDKSNLTSADYPGAAVARVKEELGEGIVAMFAQGCGANINGYPLRTTHENADAAGRKLGDAALQAAREAEPIGANGLAVRSTSIELPCQPYPSMDIWQQTVDNLEDDWKRGTESGRPVDWITEEVYRAMLEQLDAIKGKIERGESPPPRRLDATAVMLGSEWCVVALAGEMFCQYELWVGEAAPFDHTMTFGYTNGGSGYVATDDALAMGGKGGYEAGTFPCWWASNLGSALAVGTENRIREAIASLWPLW